MNKAMALEPADRYANATELADDLERLLEGRTAHAEQLSVGQRVVRYYHNPDPRLRHLRVIDLEAAVAGGVVMGLAVGLLGASRLPAPWATAVILGLVVTAIGLWLKPLVRYWRALRDSDERVGPL